MSDEKYDDKAILVNVGFVVKAESGANGARLVAVEASNEEEDSQGDIILQKALLDSANTFLKSGHFDIDHISELGHRMGIKDPERYIIGYPTAVKDIGGGRTEVKGEIMRNATGEVDPVKYPYDSFWSSLNTIPPTKWKASIYGIARDVGGNPNISGHVVKSIDWKSLAFTRKPVNKGIVGDARMVTAKAFIEGIKSESMAQGGVYEPPTCRAELLSDYSKHICRSCGETAKGDNVNLATIRDHYIKCRGLGFNEADLTAGALMHFLRRREVH